MNRLILSLTLLAASMLPAAAQHYRGFFDATINLPLSNSNGLEFIDAKGVAYGATTSHGVQVRNVFVGIGAGILLTSDSENVGVPVFAEVRYDLFTNSRASFFAGCKVGYALSMKEYTYRMDQTRSYEDFTITDGEGEQHTGKLSYSTNRNARFNGLYIQPSVGVRFRLTSVLGINVALSYLPVQLESALTTYEDLSFYNSYHIDSDIDSKYGFSNYERNVDVSKFWSHRIALSVGIDF